jgi:BlaI family penicillinase repressor
MTSSAAHFVHCLGPPKCAVWTSSPAVAAVAVSAEPFFRSVSKNPVDFQPILNYDKTNTKKPTLTGGEMARPAAKDLTDRELEIMHQFWNRGEATVADVRDGLAALGIELAQTTVGTLVRILHEKGFLEQTQSERPARFKPTKSFEDVSKNMVGEMVSRVFLGRPEQLLTCLFGDDKLTAKDRERLLKMLKEEQS